MVMLVFVRMIVLAISMAVVVMMVVVMSMIMVRAVHVIMRTLLICFLLELEHGVMTVAVRAAKHKHGQIMRHVEVDVFFGRLAQEGILLFHCGV